MKFYRKFCGALALATSFGAAALAHADEPIEFTGNAYHQAVCSRSLAPGQARCHAHVRVDWRGGLMPGRAATATRNVAPSGYAPADLRSTYAIAVTGPAPARAAASSRSPRTAATAILRLTPAGRRNKRSISTW